MFDGVGMALLQERRPCDWRGVLDNLARRRLVGATMPGDG
jgi:hypothetical protein